MFNWAFRFIEANKHFFMDAAFIFAFANLIVNTALDIAFHGLLRIRLAASPGESSKKPSVVVKPSLDLDEVDSVFNQFD